MKNNIRYTVKNIIKDSFQKNSKTLLSRDSLFTAIQHVIPQQKLSETAGRLAASQNPLVKFTFVNTFAKAYGITLDDYARKKFKDFDSFNDFFTRELEEEARPINTNEHSIVSPADGVISQIGIIKKNKLLQAKGRNYSVSQLLADKDNTESSYYDNGTFATVYLAPSNYHRVHMPFDGQLIETRYVPGTLFSVNNVTAANMPDLFARNERLVCVFETEYGQAIVVLVGAMIVAGIETVATGKIKRSKEIKIESHNINLKKGEELGRFYLGSTAIVLLPESAGVDWQDSLKHNSVVKMGEIIGMAELNKAL